MPFSKSFSLRFACAALLTASAALVAASAQEAPPSQGPPAADEDEVVRISSDLVQTDVVVLDKEGRFVEGLKREDFEVSVDGRPQPVSFFEGVAAGSREEEAALERVRRARADARASARPAALFGRGRTFFFFVDDFHLSHDSLERTRGSLRRFIDETMGPDDEAVVASASGQIGFLQQLTGNRAVLRAAVERIKPVGTSARDNDRPPMTEYLAYLIERRDPDVLPAFILQTVKETNMDARAAERIVTMRARTLLRQSDAINRAVLLTLLSVMRSAAQYPGRKLVYFFSDGFVPNLGDSDFTDMVRRVSDAAARAGVVLYALDSRGLKNGSWLDASQPAFFDATGRITRALTQEVSATQEPLHALAAATGGRAFVNSNSLDEGLARAERETARYYLLAWRPEGASTRDRSFRKLQVKVAGRPDLKVLVRSGFFSTSSPEEDERAARAAKEAKNAKGGKSPSPVAAAPADELTSALEALTTKRELPVMLSVGFERGTAGGMLLTASIEVDDAALDYGAAGTPPQQAVAEVAGAVFDTTGKSVGGFRQRLVVPPAQAGSPERRVAFSNEVPLAPGLYQVRVAARDVRSGKLGSAMEWAEVPEIKPGAFSMSSIYLAERAAGAGPGEVVVSADRRFARTSRLRFMAYVYDAARAGSSPPDVTVKIEVLRGNESVISPPEVKVAAEKAPNPAALTYAGEIGLGSLPAGRYVLQVTANDRTSKSSVTRRAEFVVL